MKKNLKIIACLILSFVGAFTIKAQSDYSESPHRFRIGVKTLIPNLAGGTAEFVLPVAGNRLSIVADYTRLGIPQFASAALDYTEDIKATLSYLALGPNFYLNNKGRAGGAYLGLRFQQLAAKTAVVSDESYSADAKQSAVAFLFGVSSAGRFWTGFEIGAGKPLGPATGSSVEVVNGQKTRTNYSESIIPVIPILNFKFGIAF